MKQFLGLFGTLTGQLRAKYIRNVFAFRNRIVRLASSFVEAASFHTGSRLSTLSLLKITVQKGERIALPLL